MKPHRSARALLLALLALAHGGLWLWIDTSLHRKLAVEPAHRTPMRLLSVRLPQLIAPAPTARKAQVLPRQQQDLTPGRSVAPASPAAPLAVAPPITPQASSGPAELEAAAPASAPRESLLDSEATRRALRQAARGPLLAERAASAMGDGAPLRPEDRLGREIQQAATTDCLKGEFLGGGAGLLSLPFWVLAEARGKCRR